MTARLRGKRGSADITPLDVSRRSTAIHSSKLSCKVFEELQRKKPYLSSNSNLSSTIHRKILRNFCFDKQIIDGASKKDLAEIFVF
jgi:hypothetical protein